MARPLRLLLIEDNPDDAALISMQFRRGNFEVTSDQVYAQDRLDQALEQPWDLALLDCHLPGFTPERALETIRKAAPELPVIALTGVVGEERAAHLMRLGCRDLVLKNKMDRLVPAAERELARVEEVAALRASAMEASEHLARSIAADLQNLLAMAGTNVELLARRPLDPAARQEIDALSEAIERGHALTADLARFGRAREQAAICCAIDDVARRIERLLAPAFRRSGVKLSTHTPDAPVWAAITATECFGMLRSLLLAAMDLAEGSGRVNLVVREDASVLVTHPGEPEAGGMRALLAGKSETQSIDLTNARRTLKERGGRIAIGGRDGNTVLQIQLKPAAAKGMGPAVLLVQAEKGLRRVVGRFLIQEGYELLEASTLADARSSSPLPDILIVDADLRGEDGTELAIELTQRLPGLRVCLLAARPAELRDRIEGKGWAVLEKPISPEQLTQVLRVLREGELRVG